MSLEVLPVFNPYPVHQLSHRENVDSTASTIQEEQASSTTSDCFTSLCGFWKHIETHFQFVGKVFLQIEENRHSFAFNGELTIESQNDFINQKDCSIAALKGLKITAKRIRNQGSLQSQAVIKLHGRHAINNDKGLVSADSDIQLQGRHISNRSGKMTAIAGQILWECGHQVTLSNEHGTLCGQFGVRRINTHKTAPREGMLPSTLDNRYGNILAPEGPIEIFLDKIENSEGLIQGQVPKIDVLSFNNKNGKLIVQGDCSQMSAVFFENNEGLVSSTQGALNLHGGHWKNGSGAVHAYLGIDGKLQKFSNKPKGLMAASAGAVAIETTYSLKQHGKIVAAHGINLSVDQGAYLGKDGVLISPNRLLVVKTHRHLLDLEGGIIEAGASILDGFEQVNLRHTHFQIDGPLQVTSQSQWIEAQHAYFAHVAGPAFFGAKESIYFDHNKGTLKALQVECQALNCDNGVFTVQEDVAIHVDRFIGNHNALSVGSKVLLQAATSISSNGSEIKVAHGSFVQESGNWVISDGDKTQADVVRRDGKSILIAQSQDEGREIINNGVERLVLQKYRAEAEDNVVLACEGKALLQRNEWEGEEIAIKGDEIWLSEIEALFYEKLSIHSQSLAAIRELHSEGRHLKVKVIQGDLSLTQSNLKNRESHLSADQNVSVTQSTIQGDLVVTSGQNQRLTDNLFGRGDVDLNSRYGDIDLNRSSIAEGENLTVNAPSGSAVIQGKSLDVKELKVKAKKAALRKVKVRAKGSLRVKGKNHAAASDAELLADQKIIFKSQELLAYSQVQVRSHKGFELFTDGVALVDKCTIVGKATVETGNVAFSETQIKGSEDAIRIEARETLVTRDTDLQGREIQLSHQDASLRTSLVSGKDQVAIQGRTRISDSAVLNKKKITIKGELATLDHSHVRSSESGIAFAATRLFMNESTLQGIELEEEGETLIAKKTQTWAVKKHSRKFSKIALTEGFDNAEALEEEADHVDRVNQKAEAINIIRLKTSRLRSHSSEYKSRDILWVSNSIDSLKDRIVASHYEVVAQVAFLTENSMENDSTTIRVERDLNLFNSSIKGPLQATAQNLNADRISITSNEPVVISVASDASLREGHIDAQKLALTGNTIGRSGSQVRVGELFEKANSFLNATESTTIVSGSMTQESGGELAIPFSQTSVAGVLFRSAAGGIEHHAAFSSASEHHVHATWFYAHCSTLNFAQGTSTFHVGQFESDQGTVLCGSGGAAFDLATPLVVSGVVNLGGLYAVTAPDIVFNAAIKAAEMQGVAFSGGLQIHGPISTAIATFVAKEDIDTDLPLSFEDWADFSAYQLWNRGAVTSKKQLRVHQTVFRDLQEVSAAEHLILSSESSICITKPYNPVGGLSLISERGNIEVRDDIHVPGRAHIKTPGELIFYRMEAHFDNDVLIDMGTMLNDASTLIFREDLSIQGGSIENRNLTFISSHQEQIGSYRKTFCGIGYGKKQKIYAWVHEIVIERVANTQVGGVLNLNLTGKVNNDGVIFAKKIQGVVGSLDNGIFHSMGRTPLAYSQPLECLVAGMNFRPGGEFRSLEGTALQMPGALRNRGFVESHGPVAFESGQLLNERRTTMESEQVIRTKRWGRRSAHYVETDHLEPGGLIRGSETLIKTGVAANMGGCIEGESGLSLQADHYDLQALSLRKVVHLKAGKPAFWQSASGHSIRREIIPAETTSGGDLQMTIEYHFKNVASDVTAFGDLEITVGSLEAITVFDSYRSQEKRTWKTSKDSYTQTMREPRMRGVGDLAIKSTKKHIHLEGECGSLGGSARIESAGDIIFHSRTHSVENTVSSFDFTPTSVTYSTRESNNTLTSVPHFFAGGGSGTLIAKGAIAGEAVQFTIADDLIGNAQAIRLSDHQVERHQSVDGLSFGVTFFGSEALNSIAAGKPLHKTVEALLREDTAISSAFDLACAIRNEDGVAIASNALQTAVHTWNNTAKFSRAFNDDRLGDAVGEHLGITTDEDGEFNPRITGRLGSFDQNVEQSISLPTRFSVGGNIVFTADEQSYKGCQVERLGGGAEFIGNEITFAAATERFVAEGSNFGLSVSVGPQGPSVGVDFAEQKSRGISYQHTNLDFGKNLKIRAASSLTLSGLALEADYADVVVKDAKIESMQDSYEHHAMSAALSTAGNFSYAEASGHSQQVNTIAGIKGRFGGQFHAEQTELVGGSLENLDVQVKHLQHRDVHNSSSERSFSVKGNFKTISEVLTGSSKEALPLLGVVDYSSSKEKGRTLATIAGSNGAAYGGINTDVNARQRIEKKDKVHLAAAVIAPNWERLEEDYQAIGQAFGSKPEKPKAMVAMPPVVAQPPEMKKEISPSKKEPLKRIQDKQKIQQERTKKKKEQAVDFPAASDKQGLKNSTERPVLVETMTARHLTDDSIELLSTINPQSNSSYAISVPSSHQHLGDKSKDKDLSPPLFEDPNLSLYGEQSYESWSKNNWLDMIAHADFMATVGRTLAYPFTKSAEWYCQSASGEMNCRLASMAYNKSVDYASDKMPEKVVNWWQERQQAISSSAEYNEKVLDIPKEMTFKFYQDGEESVVNLMLMALANSGKLLSLANKALPRSKPSPHWEILERGDMRGLHAKDVTPLSKPMIPGQIVPVAPAQLPASVTPKAKSAPSKMLVYSDSTAVTHNYLLPSGLVETGIPPKPQYKFHIADLPYIKTVPSNVTNKINPIVPKPYTRFYHENPWKQLPKPLLPKLKGIYDILTGNCNQTIMNVTFSEDRQLTAAIHTLQNRRDSMGHVLRTINSLKQEAIQNNATKLIIEVEALNERLLQFFSKRYRYLETSTTNHLGLKTWERLSEFHRIEIPLEVNQVLVPSKKVEPKPNLAIEGIKKASDLAKVKPIVQKPKRNKEFPTIDGVYFTSENWSERIDTHYFALNTPAEGFIDYRYVLGTEKSVLIFLGMVQKGKKINWEIKPVPGHKPYITSEAALEELKKIGNNLGCDKVYLQFEPLNPKFFEYVEKNYSFKGKHFVKNKDACEVDPMGPYPIFEIYPHQIQKSNLDNSKAMPQEPTWNMEFPTIDDIYFTSENWSNPIENHYFALDTPAEGFIDYRYVLGTEKSVLILLEMIQKGKEVNWHIGSAQDSGHRSYITSDAALDELKQIGNNLGCDKIFLQFKPENLKFLSYMKRNYPFKGEYLTKTNTPLDDDLMGPYPIFEISSRLTFTEVGDTSSTLLNSRLSDAQAAFRNITTFRKITHLSEFKKDMKTLSKRFRSIEEDIHNLVTTRIMPFHKLGADNSGIFRLAQLGFQAPPVFKAKKIACQALKELGSKSGLRVIYTYIPEKDEVMFLEVYHKSDQISENRERMQSQLKQKWSK